MPNMYGDEYNKAWHVAQRARRNAYAQKLRNLGIHENGSKWRALMYRKGF